jgi:hypothetical protein
MVRGQKQIMGMSKIMSRRWGKQRAEGSYGIEYEHDYAEGVGTPRFPTRVFVVGLGLRERLGVETMPT